MKRNVSAVLAILLAMVWLPSFTWAGSKITKLSVAEKKLSGCLQALMDLELSAEALKYSVQGLQKTINNGEPKARRAGHKGMKFAKNTSSTWRGKKNDVKKAVSTYKKKCKGITEMTKGGLKFD